MKNDIAQTLVIQSSSGEYPIYIGKDLLSQKKLLQEKIVSQQIMIISNKTIANFYLKKLTSSLKNYNCDCLILPDGEAYKNFDTFKKILDELAEKQHHRDTTIIALGGGVIGDITGFAAACFHRGVAYLQIPTTLLAQVDSSIGGKTAINHSLGKNLIGAFYQPNAVFIDIDTLLTLPDREFRAGMAEVIKAALIADADFFMWLEQNLEDILKKKNSVLIPMIKLAVSIKAAIVESDEKEKTGQRALLNLGHTFGHAIEQNLGYGKWLHGEAVAMGTVLAAHLSHQFNWIDQNDFNRINTLFERLQLPTQLPSKLKCDKLIKAMMSDKKIMGNKLHLILLKSIGKAVAVNTINIETIESTLKDFLN